ncbi:Hypothetical protein NocV09_08000010, partial [Nannochloropsis oceanica]
MNTRAGSKKTERYYAGRGDRMSGLLSGLKFVGKKKEEKQEKDEAIARPVYNPAMSWMSGPIDLLGSRKPTEEQQVESSAARAVREEEAAKKAKVDEEIKAGIRDAQGMRFGLTVMKKDATRSSSSSGSSESLALHASAHLVGDAGATWRVRALRRAREEAARTGKKLEE